MRQKTTKILGSLPFFLAKKMELFILLPDLRPRSRTVSMCFSVGGKWGSERSHVNMERTITPPRKPPVRFNWAVVETVQSMKGAMTCKVSALKHNVGFGVMDLYCFTIAQKLKTKKYRFFFFVFWKQTLHSESSSVLPEKGSKADLVVTKMAV